MRHPVYRVRQVAATSKNTFAAPLIISTFRIQKHHLEDDSSIYCILCMLVIRTYISTPYLRHPLYYRKISFFIIIEDKPNLEFSADKGNKKIFPASAPENRGLLGRLATDAFRGNTADG